MKPPQAKKMNGFLERIAIALERIADSLEQEDGSIELAMSGSRPPRVCTCFAFLPNSQHADDCLVNRIAPDGCISVAIPSQCKCKGGPYFDDMRHPDTDCPLHNTKTEDSPKVENCSCDAPEDAKPYQHDSDCPISSDDCTCLNKSDEYGRDHDKDCARFLLF
jgi:hypothetical protein